MNTSSSKRPADRRGFSLTEVLVVMALVSFLVSMTVPAWNAITQSQGVSVGAYNLAGLLELARKEAITRQTYVWVGFETMERHGQSAVVAAAVYSSDGSGANTSAENLVPIGKPVVVPGARLADRADLGTGLRELLPAETATPLKNAEGVAFTVGTWTFSGNSVTITPGGEVLLKGAVGPYDGYVPQMEVGVSQCQGGKIGPGSRQAALVIQGAQGAVRVLEVQ